MSNLFLSLNDAVDIAVKNFDIDEILARQEFKQKCYISDNQYDIGYYDGLYKALNAIKEVMEI